VAADYAMDLGLDAIEARVTGLAQRLRDRLSELPGVAVHDQGSRRCGIVSFTVDGVPAAEVRARLRAAAVNVSVSQVEYARLDLEHRQLPDLVRASVHYYNTDEELDRLVRALT
jgi:selenocysteine lyase/cysteine desulfurase